MIHQNHCERVLESRLIAGFAKGIYTQGNSGFTMLKRLFYCVVGINILLFAGCGGVTIVNTGFSLAGQNDFGSVAVGSFADHVFTLTNKGKQPIDSLVFPALSSPFSEEANGCGATLLENANCTFTIRFKPTSATASQITIEVAGNRNNAKVQTESLALSGTGTAATNDFKTAIASLGDFISIDPANVPALQALRAAAQISSASDPQAWKKIGVPELEQLYNQPMPMEKEYAAKEAVDPCWATKPTYKSTFTQAELQNLCNRSYYPPPSKLDRKFGIAFRGDGRDFAQVKASGGFLPPSDYPAGSKDKIELLIDAYEGVAGQQGGHLDKKTKGGRETQVTNGYRNAFTKRSLAYFDRLFWKNALKAAGAKRTAITEFFDKTRENPYIQTITPVAKHFVSLSFSPNVAKSYNCYFDQNTNQFTWSKQFFLYAIISDYGLKIPEKHGVVWVDPWCEKPDNQCPPHPFRGAESHEEVYPGTLGVERIVGYVEIKNGKPVGNIYVREHFENLNAQAYDQVVEALAGRYYPPNGIDPGPFVPPSGGWCH
jgi:hypothetical protein